MDARELINRVRNGDRLLELKKEELLRLESICRYQGISYDKVPSVPKPNSKEKAYLNLIEFKDEIDILRDRLLEDRKKLTSIIDTFQSSFLLYEIISLYCLQGKSIKQIAKEKHYSRGYVYKRFKEAVELIDKALQEETKGEQQSANIRV